MWGGGIWQVKEAAPSLPPQKQQMLSQIGLVNFHFKFPLVVLGYKQICTPNPRKLQISEPDVPRQKYSTEPEISLLSLSSPKSGTQSIYIYIHNIHTDTYITQSEKNIHPYNEDSVVIQKFGPHNSCFSRCLGEFHFFTPTAMARCGGLKSASWQDPGTTFRTARRHLFGKRVFSSHVYGG